MKAILDAAGRAGVTPIVADVKAVSPATVGRLAAMAAAAV